VNPRYRIEERISLYCLWTGDESCRDIPPQWSQQLGGQTYVLRVTAVWRSGDVELRGVRESPILFPPVP
jgi:hypothetical protein